MMARPLRVMHVLSSLATGGAELNTLRLSSVLETRGFKQLVVSLTPRIDAALGVHGNVPLTCPGSRIRAGGGPWLASVARDFKPDVIHGRGFRTWFACVYAQLMRCRETRLLQSFHGPASFEHRRCRRALAARVLQGRTDAFVAVSQDVVSRLKGWGTPPRRVHLVYNGVDVDQFRPAGDRRAAKSRLNIHPESFVVGAVGSLRPVKNHQLLLEAFAAFRRRGENSTLLLVGDGPLRNVLEEQTRRLGIAGWTVFCGRQRVVPDYLAAMDVLVQPSLQEGSPTAVLEAMACGLPVIAVPGPGCNELHAKTTQPLLAEAPCAAAVESLLLQLARDESRRRQLGAQARKIICRSFTAGHMVSSYERIYRGLVEIDSLPAPQAVA